MSPTPLFLSLWGIINGPHSFLWGTQRINGIIPFYITITIWCYPVQQVPRITTAFTCQFQACAFISSYNTPYCISSKSFHLLLPLFFHCSLKNCYHTLTVIEQLGYKRTLVDLFAQVPQCLFCHALTPDMNAILETPIIPTITSHDTIYADMVHTNQVHVQVV